MQRCFAVVKAWMFLLPLHVSLSNRARMGRNDEEGNIRNVWENAKSAL